MLSSIIKIFSNQSSTLELSIHEFSDAFSNLLASLPAKTIDLQYFLSYLQNYTYIEVTNTALQVIAFIVGYSVHALINQIIVNYYHRK